VSILSLPYPFLPILKRCVGFTMLTFPFFSSLSLHPPPRSSSFSPQMAPATITTTLLRRVQLRFLFSSGDLLQVLFLKTLHITVAAATAARSVDACGFCVFQMQPILFSILLKIPDKSQLHITLHPFFQDTTPMTLPSAVSSCLFFRRNLSYLEGPLSPSTSSSSPPPPPNFLAHLSR
jgi:hypothetical protein